MSCLFKALTSRGCCIEYKPPKPQDWIRRIQIQTSKKSELEEGTEFSVMFGPKLHQTETSGIFPEIQCLAR